MTDTTLRLAKGAANASDQTTTKTATAGDLRVSVHVPLDRKASAHIDNMIASQVGLGLTWGEHIYAMVLSINAILAEPESASERQRVTDLVTAAIRNGNADALKAELEKA